MAHFIHHDYNCNVHDRKQCIKKTKTNCKTYENLSYLERFFFQYKADPVLLYSYFQSKQFFSEKKNHILSNFVFYR